MTALESVQTLVAHRQLHTLADGGPWPDRLADAASASYPVLVIAVVLGAIVPVIPTGAVVSAASVLALHQGGFGLLEVIGLAAVSAFVGDCALYAAFRGGRHGLVRLFGHKVEVGVGVAAGAVAGGEGADRLAETRRRLEENGLQVLIVSRLIPGGRIPAMLAASAVRYPWPRYASGAAVAAVVWAVAYAAMGLLGGSLFDNTWVGIGFTVLIVLLVTVLARLVQRWRENRGGGPSGSGAAAAGAASEPGDATASAAG